MDENLDNARQQEPVFIEEAGQEEIVEAALNLAPGDDEAVLILIGEHNQTDIPAMIEGLSRRGITFFGGVFPGVIHGQVKSETGVVLAVLPLFGKPIRINNISAGNFTLPDFGEFRSNAQDQETLMVLVDGLTENIAAFMARLYDKLANTVSYMGGGAGSLTLEQKPCLFTADGFFQDGALLALVKLKSHQGVRHGWEHYKGPLVATRTARNVIHELNWRPAFEVYREVVEADLGRVIKPEGFFEIAKGYPFGMLKDYAECIVRDPIAVGPDGELICVGEVPENTVLEILKGNSPSLIEAAAAAAADCRGAAGKTVAACFVVDCISRVLFLEADFSQELKKVRTGLNDIVPAVVPAGILTLGEISSYGDGYLEFFNKTIVVGVLHA